MSAADTLRIVVVGAGQAAVQIAQSLRKRNFGGPVTLIGNEGYAPYQRPPLSKAFLKGEMDESRLAFKPNTYYAKHDVQCDLANAATEIDTAAQTVVCTNGASVSYDRLVLATGAAPLNLPVPGASLPEVFALRGIDDAKAIRGCLATASRLAVIGGGYIGLEVASAARQMGLDVSVIERMPQLLSRVTSPPVSDYFLELHRRRGIDVKLDESVVEIIGEDAVAGVRLTSGETLPCDAVLVGVGVRPNDAIAAAAGIECDDGILVDSRCRTSNPGIYAAGDCARLVRADDASIRLESVHNALVQGEAIAADIVGAEPPPFDPPWFWSDQYEIKLQTVGLFNGFDDVLVRGNVSADKFAALYFRHDRLIAVDAINDPVSFMAGKQILRRGINVSCSAVADPEISLRDLVPKPPR